VQQKRSPTDPSTISDVDAVGNSRGHHYSQSRNCYEPRLSFVLTLTDLKTSSTATNAFRRNSTMSAPKWNASPKCSAPSEHR